jgi:hypothetical protein
MSIYLFDARYRELAAKVLGRTIVSKPRVPTGKTGIRRTVDNSQYRRWQMCGLTVREELRLANVTSKKCEPGLTIQEFLDSPVRVRMEYMEMALEKPFKSNRGRKSTINEDREIAALFKSGDGERWKGPKEFVEKMKPKRKDDGKLISVSSLGHLLKRVEDAGGVQSIE